LAVPIVEAVPGIVAPVAVVAIAVMNDLNNNR